MKRFFSLMTGLSIVAAAGLWIPSYLKADDLSSTEAVVPPSSDTSNSGSTDAAQKELTDAKESLDSMSNLESLKPKADVATKTTNPQSQHSAEAFVVGPDWEFDGFVAGGQDQSIKSMFAVNDLIYLNVGSAHGFHSGDRIGIYRRGEKIRDPQSSRLLGYEVRKIAISEVSDRIEDGNCSARILKSYEAVEIGDIARREE